MTAWSRLRDNVRIDRGVVGGPYRTRFDLAAPQGVPVMSVLPPGSRWSADNSSAAGADADLVLRQATNPSGRTSTAPLARLPRPQRADQCRSRGCALCGMAKLGTSLHMICFAMTEDLSEKCLGLLLCVIDLRAAF
jgi:hypothetical protein